MLHLTRVTMPRTSIVQICTINSWSSFSVARDRLSHWQKETVLQYIGQCLVEQWNIPERKAVQTWEWSNCPFLSYWLFFFTKPSKSIKGFPSLHTPLSIPIHTCTHRNWSPLFSWVVTPLLRYIKDWVHVERARPKIIVFIYTLSNDYHAPGMPPAVRARVYNGEGWFYALELLLGLPLDLLTAYATLKRVSVLVERSLRVRSIVLVHVRSGENVHVWQYLYTVAWCVLIHVLTSRYKDGVQIGDG